MDLLEALASLFLKIRTSDNADQSDDVRERREAEIEDDDAADEEEDGT